MATPEEIKRLLDDLDAQYKKLGTSNPFKNFDASAFKDAADAVKILESGLSDVTRQLEIQANTLENVAAGFQSITQELQNQNKALSSTKSNYGKLEDIARSLRNEQQGIIKLSEKDLKTLAEKAKIAKQTLLDNKSTLEQQKKEILEKLKTKGLDTLSLSQRKKLRGEYKKIKSAIGDIAGLENDEDIHYATLEDRLKKRIAQEEHIRKTIGLTGALLKGIGGTLQKLGFDSEIVSGALEAAEESAKKGGDGFQSMGAALKSLSGGIKKQLSDPMFQVGIIVCGYYKIT